MCIDCRGLDLVVVADPAPLLRAEGLSRRLEGCQCCLTADLSERCWQVPVANGNVTGPRS